MEGRDGTIFLSLNSLTTKLANITKMESLQKWALIMDGYLFDQKIRDNAYERLKKASICSISTSGHSGQIFKVYHQYRNKKFSINIGNP